MTPDFPVADPTALAALERRRSVPARMLGEPGPDRQQLAAMLALAVRVPDHGKLTPWRLLAIRGEARDRLGEFLVERHRQIEPEVAAAVLDKDRQRFSHAPLVLVVICSPRETDRIPEQEQLLSAGCLAFALLQAAQACGFAGQWLTGWPAYDAAVAEQLGVAAHEKIVGFVHVGRATGEAPERQRPDPLELLAEWQP